MALLNSKPPLEVWAGVECTVNRVGNRYFDQLERNGHGTRLDDLDLFAQLGIHAIRYPILWERIAPDGLENANWSWADTRLERLQELGIRPIVGLVHHGSGPRHTSLIDPAFPEKLADFARAVADRYPWVTHYTPINEPLTTARFSGLYGHWYPHGHDDRTFVRALLGQIRAIALSMAAIREVNPQAQLVQTEDLAKVFSTPLLAYQATFENERRWLSFDLLCGRVSPTHPMWQYLQKCGIKEAELAEFSDNPCLPDIIGVNHYLTSDRFLDERTERYPIWTYGGNGKHQYADVEAVRVRAEGIAGHRCLLQEVWERYQLPIAVTEVHLHCTREEQLRWLYEVWQTAQELRQQVDIRAVTAWSLLGSYDWNTLLTCCVGDYESGVFDLRSPHPRPTAIAKFVRDLATGQTPSHPLLTTPGWWHRQERLLYPAYQTEQDSNEVSISSAPHPSRLAIIGATGTLGKAFARICAARGIAYHLLTRQDVNITDPASVDAMLAQLQPWAVVNAAGYVRVDDAEREPNVCMQVNAEGSAILAAACARSNVPLVTFSSDLVFDGAVSNPYTESDRVAPLNVYGRSKALAEQQVLQAHPSALVVRTSAFFGPWDDYNFVTLALRQLRQGQMFVAAEDVVISPTYVPDLVNTSLDLLIDGESGLWHLANRGAIAWAELAWLVAKKAGLNVDFIIARPLQELGFTALRPSYSVLGSDRGQLLPPLGSAIARYFDEIEQLDK
ncbi:dTDP-4-dehydrorhamnose reductase [Gloeocapsa sp. PCC 7428]|uniref:family 1 glycosylhydrolase n=1 Tax=Gloeocapsa sp. PCC 7428 TaxID=1173026 RepID=UPI0002A5BCCA|nr:family 1 glycosylhydrolase [Gloeocapsa sp. PCC 7428]AFZ31491.1 dTDP-4-dehydrorhamnose reductase [Gloeocapsa sp. PCC 7428]